MRRLARTYIAFAAICFLLGCAGATDSFTESLPAELVGQWRLIGSRAKPTDVTDWHADGSMTGVGNPQVPADARWVVRAFAKAGARLCVGGGGQANCQPFSFRGDTLIWGSDADPSRFIRIRSDSK